MGSEPAPRMYTLDDTGDLHLSPTANQTLSYTMIGDSGNVSPGQSRGQMRGRKIHDWRRALKIRQADTVDLGGSVALPALNTRAATPDLPSMDVLSPGLVGDPAGGK